MTKITLDTLAYSKKLRDAGVPEQQAEAQALALAAVLKETSGDLATKQDVDRLSDKVEGQFKLLHWMIGFNLVLTAGVLWLLLRSAI